MLGMFPPRAMRRRRAPSPKRCSCPTISSAFVSAFYGSQHFSMNFSIMNFNLMGASLLATVSSMLFTSSGGYAAPFVLLLVLSGAALVLNLSVKKP